VGVRARLPGCTNKTPASTVNESTNIPRVHVRINQWTGTALLDTGSTHSLLSLNVLKKLKLLKRNSLRVVDINVKLLQGQKSSAIYKATLHVIIAGRHIKNDFFVVDNMVVDAIIGADIIQKLGIVPMLKKRGFSFQNLVPDDCNIVPFVEKTGASESRDPVTLSSVGAHTLSAAQVECIAQARTLTHLTPEQQHTLEQTLLKFSDTITDTRIGLTDVYEHEIRVTTDKPLKSRPYKTSPAKRKIINQKVNELLLQGILVPSNSQYASPVCAIKKGERDHRLVVDARKINAITESDAYPAPTIDTILNSMNGAAYFSIIDLKQAFNQIKLHKNSRKYAAIVTEDGLFEFTRVNFGGKNSGAIFQRTMDHVLADYKGKCCWPYCDDIVVFSKTFNDHIRDISHVLGALQKK
jgi:hypothetical protein